MDETQAKLDLEQRVRNWQITSQEQLNAKLLEAYEDAFGAYGREEFKDVLLPTLADIHGTNYVASGLEALTLIEEVVYNNIAASLVGRHFESWALTKIQEFENSKSSPPSVPRRGKYSQASRQKPRPELPEPYQRQNKYSQELRQKPGLGLLESYQRRKLGLIDRIRNLLEENQDVPTFPRNVRIPLRQYIGDYIHILILEQGSTQKILARDNYRELGFGVISSANDYISSVCNYTNTEVSRNSIYQKNLRRLSILLSILHVDADDPIVNPIKILYPTFEYNTSSQNLPR